MTTNITNNDRTRKSLASQIDRLDSILDGLSDGLNDAVATAVKDAVSIAVKETVQGIVTELLTNPEIMTRLQPTPPASPMSPPPGPTWRDRLNGLRAAMSARWQDVRQGCAAGAKAVQQGAAKCLRGTCQAASKVWSRCQLLSKIKNQVLTALGVGAAAALLTWWAGPWLATTISGIAGFVTTLATQLGEWVRGLFSGTPCPTS